MRRLAKQIHTRGLRAGIAMIVATLGFGVAALVAVAAAKTFTLQAAANASVTNQAGATSHESILVTSGGFAVYTLSGDSRQHPKCTSANGCLAVWPPVTVSSSRKLSKAAGVKGKLGVWRRGRLLQVTLAGHPLYRFASDARRDHATGEGVKAFGGTWHVIKAASSRGPTTTPSTSTTTTTSTTTPCVYPPYC
jgi:predicted lipoprotein with Yx(FWY)xxD motif